ncbi:hypothetical protein AXG93_4541s1040 [Marchantia polymorpha subsp. ruderalis]|uniref:CCHC-type domain-containing protein n=1 Tax=Marchantia polymorpha subsp. ruderalis TaxID=1480154 RepID=A0A176VUN2_MARPO|nr:hypothetical protein AXG93_4541s1040 [Marchantia polymorpha subsp. ruderalis]
MMHPRHFTEAGPSSQPESPAKTSSSRQKMKCFYCKKKGHLASECRKKKHDSASSHSTPNDHQRLYVTALTSIGMDPAWYVDSGATQHMAYNKNAFVTYTELPSKEFVYLGDDSRQLIQGKGLERLLSTHLQFLLMFVIRLPTPKSWTPTNGISSSAI